MGVKDYDLNPDNNTQINGINIAEGCPPSGINNAVRQLMADVKADSDAQDTAIEALKTKAETPASAENLGPVKVGDGLTMGEDGTLSADLATDAKAGRVKASTTAQAGAVPLGGADGSLGEDWLKKAMQAAEKKTTPVQVAEYGAPDFARSVDITISTTAYTQCIPEDGFLQITWSGSNSQAYNYILKSTTGSDQPATKYLCAFVGEGFVHGGLFPVSKDIYLKRQSASSSNFVAQFIPAKGVNWNA